jgi:hypothetical protein
MSPRFYGEAYVETTAREQYRSIVMRAQNHRQLSVEPPKSMRTASRCCAVDGYALVPDRQLLSASDDLQDLDEHAAAGRDQGRDDKGVWRMFGWLHMTHASVKKS